MQAMRLAILIPQLQARPISALQHLLQEKDFEVIGVIRSESDMLGKKGRWYIRKAVRRAGILYATLIGIAIIAPAIGLSLAGVFFIKNRRKRRRLKTFDELKTHHKFHTLETHDINNPTSINILKSWKPDLIVSLYFDQILKKPVFEIPKMGALNMHPGLLPKYRGLWPEFWKLHNKEKYGGVTIHYINEGIDAGAIIAQTKYRIQKNDSKYSLDLKSNKYGIPLLIKTIKKLKKGIKLPPIKLKGKARYYSIPEKKHLNRFFQRGKKLFSFQEIWENFS